MRFKYTKSPFFRIILFICAFLLFIGTVIFIQSIFTIKHIEVSGAQATVQIDESILPKSLLFFPTDQVEKNIRNDYPVISAVHIVKKWPSTLRLEIVLKNPILQVQTNNRLVGVDIEGRVISDITGNRLPILFLPLESVTVGTVINHPAISPVVSFIDTYHPTDQTITITLKEKKTIEIAYEQFIVLISESTDGKVAANALQQVLSGFRMKGSLPKTIDLRFAKPVITF